MRAYRQIAVLCFALVAGTAAATKPTASVTCRVELDRNVLPADRPATAVLKVTLDAVKPQPRQRPPVNLSIVLDHSGSMSGQKLENAKKAAIEALRHLNGDDIFSLVIYDHTVETVVHAGRPTDKESLESQIRQISAGGNTALFGGVSQGAAEIRKHLDEKYVQRIILLSDGLANVGPSSPEDLGRLGRGLIKEGISVSTVGVGTDYNEDLMTRLSERSDGNTYFVQSSTDLPRIFSAELGEVMAIVAKKVKVTIECEDGIEPVSLIGREGRIRGRHVELYLNQLYGGQEKYALIEIHIPTGKAGEARDVAIARVSYEDALTQRTASSVATASTRFSENREELLAADNVRVQKAYLVSQNAVAQNEAIALADEGNNKQAAEVLKTSAQQLRDKGEKFNDKDLLEKAVQMDQQADEMNTEGLSNVSRKAMRAEAYQDMHQQVAR